MKIRHISLFLTLLLLSGCYDPVSSCHERGYENGRVTDWCRFTTATEQGTLCYNGAVGAGSASQQNIDAGTAECLPAGRIWGRMW